MKQDYNIKNLINRIKNLEDGQRIEKEYAQKALNFTKFIISFFIIILSIAGTSLYYTWGQTKDEIKEEAKKKLNELQSEEIFVNYKKEADQIIENLKNELKRKEELAKLENSRSFYQGFGETQKALEIGEKIIQLSPEDPFGYYNQAVYYTFSDINDKEEFIRKHLIRALELNEKEILEFLRVDSYFFEYKDAPWFIELLNGQKYKY